MVGSHFSHSAPSFFSVVAARFSRGVVGAIFSFFCCVLFCRCRSLHPILDRSAVDGNNRVLGFRYHGAGVIESSRRQASSLRLWDFVLSAIDHD